jgi:hypothetical protein
MTIHLRTTAEGCNITVNIKQGGQLLLSLTDNDEGSLDLEPAVTYRFEWFVFTNREAHARIQAQILPDLQDFPPLDIDKNYPPGVTDGNVFLFNTN